MTTTLSPADIKHTPLNHDRLTTVGNGGSAQSGVSTLLMVEDFPLMREAIKEALVDYPEVDLIAERGDGLSGIEAALELQPDIMLLDLNMPGASGMTVLERVREDSPDTRVIIFTSCERPDMVLAMMAAGAAGYVSKRCSVTELRDAISEVRLGGTVISSHLAGQVLATMQANAVKPPAMFSQSEVEVLRRVAAGKTDNEIASELDISRRTVQNRLGGIRKKTQKKSRSQLTRWAIEHSWL